ncbi:hypothetical protein L2E82_03878 [Cichorium intybus]|uniref:Uncharacterized protein n=1 Tax=Cichorium intybus TaxID=13427 RepID=A0ACB9H6S1_CICIN|nr:hypothetical protein L2E82_03878 [Cichorium intybus]
MKKSERPNASKLEDGVDLISSMPDGILVLILSRIPYTEEVIRSSILSGRWSMSMVDKWIHAAVTRNVKKLDLWFCPKDITEDVEMPQCLVTCGSLEGMKESERPKASKREGGVDLISSMPDDYYSMSTVGRWIHAAVTRNVKELDLWFCPKDITDDVEMPHCLVTYGSLEDFHGRYSSLDEVETRRILTRDGKRVEVFEFNGEMPDLSLVWYDDRLEMFYNWWGRNRVLS